MTPNDKADLKWAMQAALLEQASVLTENKQTVKDFILNEATYEQLLNLTFNPYNSNEVYMEAEDLEWVAKDVVYEMAGIGKNGHSNVDTSTTSGKFNLIESIVQGKSLNEDSKMQSLGQFARDKADAVKDAYKSGVAGRQAQGKGKVASAVGSATQIAKTAARNNPKTAAALGVAGAAGAYMLYRKARKAGKSQEEAAAVAAKAAKTPEEKAKWAAKAKANKGK